jgi:hypothetical protein
MPAVRIVELLISTTLMWAPPQATSPAGPEDADGSGPDPADPDPDPDGTGDTATSGLPDDSDAQLDADPGPDVAAIVEAAVAAAKDRAYLQRTNREVEEYVHQLDELANVDAELDTCARAIQAEIRMALALAYLEADGTCAETEEGAAADISENDGTPAAASPLPVLECSDVAGPRECADRLLEQVAQFASGGPAGTPAPFSQAFGCPHAVAQMSVEQMFGSCLSEQYDQAITRWETSQGVEAPPPDPGPEPWPIPRWASIAGVSGGAALLITGGVLLGINGKCPGGHDPVTEVDLCPSVYNTDVSGGVLIGVGSVVVLGMGAVLTITELQRAKQGKTRESALRRRIDRAQALTGLRLSIPRPRLGRPL